MARLAHALGLLCAFATSARPTERPVSIQCRPSIVEAPTSPLTPGEYVGSALASHESHALEPLTSMPCLEAQLDRHILWRRPLANASLSSPPSRVRPRFDRQNPLALPVIIVTASTPKYQKRAASLVAELIAAGFAARDIVTAEYGALSSSCSFRFCCTNQS